MASAIYGDTPHSVEPLGLILDAGVRAELQRFMTEFCAFVEVRESDEKYFRLDLYFDGETVSVIEINV